MVRRATRQILRALRRTTVLLIGGLVLIAGIAMIVLPGPAIVAIPAGLGLLALEFEWAARLRDEARARLHRARSRGTTEPTAEDPAA